MNFRSLTKLTAAAALLASLTGCYTTTLSWDEPGMAPNAQIVRSFKTEYKVHHLIVGLVTLNDPDVKALIAQEVQRAGGKAAKNVRLVHQHTFIDGLLGGITSGIYTPSTVFIEGDVVR